MLAFRAQLRLECQEASWMLCLDPRSAENANKPTGATLMPGQLIHLGCPVPELWRHLLASAAVLTGGPDLVGHGPQACILRPGLVE